MLLRSSSALPSHLHKISSNDKTSLSNYEMCKTSSLRSDTTANSEWNVLLDCSNMYAIHPTPVSISITDPPAPIAT